MKLIHKKPRGRVETIEFASETNSEANRMKKLYWSNLLPPFVSISYYKDRISFVCHTIHYVEVECPACGQRQLKNLMRNKKDAAK